MIKKSVRAQRGTSEREAEEERSDDKATSKRETSKRGHGRGASLGRDGARADRESGGRATTQRDRRARNQAEGAQTSHSERRERERRRARKGEQEGGRTNAKEGGHGFGRAPTEEEEALFPFVKSLTISKLGFYTRKFTAVLLTPPKRLLTNVYLPFVKARHFFTFVIYICKAGDRGKPSEGKA